MPSKPNSSTIIENIPQYELPKPPKPHVTDLNNRKYPRQGTDKTDKTPSPPRIIENAHH
jgi:hypothetical protein